MSTGNKIEYLCDICAQEIPGASRKKIFAIGKCDHPVCYVCSARLRVVCDQFDCPICREKLDTVIFTSNKKTNYENFNSKNCLFSENYKIYFESKAIKNSFEKLLRYECLECLKSNKNEVFIDVITLKDHLNKVHKLKLCDLCLKHNKVFPFEYSYYDVTNLRKHMKSGEPKTSHRGHPNCDLCHNTFFNNDELILHMSRDHFHCHLCGRQDSNMRIYFLDYLSLRDHFKSKHYLCERDNCRHEQFTSAFDTRFEYLVHLNQVHGQQDTILLDTEPHRAARNLSQMRRNIPRNAAIVSTGPVATANNPASLNAERPQRLPTRNEFPALGQGTVRISSVPANSQNSTMSQRVAAGSSNARGCGRTPNQLSEMDFPPLPERPEPKNVKGGNNNNNNNNNSNNLNNGGNRFNKSNQNKTRMQKPRRKW